MAFDWKTPGGFAGLRSLISGSSSLPTGWGRADILEARKAYSDPMNIYASRTPMFSEVRKLDQWDNETPFEPMFKGTGPGGEVTEQDTKLPGVTASSLTAPKPTVTYQEQPKSVVYGTAGQAGSYTEEAKPLLASYFQGNIASNPGQSQAALNRPDPAALYQQELARRKAEIANRSNPYSVLLDPYARGNAGEMAAKSQIYGQTQGAMGNALLQNRAMNAQYGIASDSGLNSDQELRARLEASKLGSSQMADVDRAYYDKSQDWQWRRTSASDAFEQERQRALANAEDLAYKTGTFDPLAIRAQDLANQLSAENLKYQVEENPMRLQQLGQAIRAATLGNDYQERANPLNLRQLEVQTQYAPDTAAAQLQQLLGANTSTALSNQYAQKSLPARLQQLALANEGTGYQNQSLMYNSLMDKRNYDKADLNMWLGLLSQLIGAGGSIAGRFIKPF